MEPQKTQNCQSKTEEKEQSWRHNPPGFRQYYKATVSKMLRKKPKELFGQPNIYNGILLSHIKIMKYCHLQQHGWT